MPLRLTTRSAILACALLGAAGVTAGMVKLGSVPAGAAAPGAEEAAAPPADCAARLAGAEAKVGATLARLQAARNAGRAGRCEAYRAHVAVLGEAAEAYGACLTGFARDETLAQFEIAADDWTAVIGDVCEPSATVVDASY